MDQRVEVVRERHVSFTHCSNVLQKTLRHTEAIYQPAAQWECLASPHHLPSKYNSSIIYHIICSRFQTNSPASNRARSARPLLPSAARLFQFIRHDLHKNTDVGTQPGKWWRFLAYQSSIAPRIVFLARHGHQFCLLSRVRNRKGGCSALSQQQ